MKKLLCVAMTLLLCAMIFAKGNKDTQAGTQKKVVLRWGSVHTSASITTQLMNRIIEGVNSKTGGRVEMQGFPTGSLGSSRDLVEGVQTGIVEMCTEGPAQFGSVIPLATIAEAPYVWRDRDHLNKALNGTFGHRLNQEFEKRNVHILGAIYYGTRQLTTSNKSIRSVSDTQGMKIRVPEVDTYLAMIESWGAKPTPLSFNELYMALQQNVVDGQENPLTTFDGSKFYEVQKYIIRTNHIICPNMIFINNDVWGKIGAADQKIISDVIAESIAWHDVKVLESEEDLIALFRAKGVTVVDPDVNSFREATIKVVSKCFENKWGKGTWEFIQDIK